MAVLGEELRAAVVDLPSGIFGSCLVPFASFVSLLWIFPAWLPLAPDNKCLHLYLVW